jgi:hypothetical protein
VMALFKPILVAFLTTFDSWWCPRIKGYQFHCRVAGQSLWLSSGHWIAWHYEGTTISIFQGAQR